LTKRTLYVIIKQVLGTFISYFNISWKGLDMKRKKKGRFYKGEKLEMSTSFFEFLGIAFIIVLILVFLYVFITSDGSFGLTSIVMKILSLLIGEKAVKSKEVSTIKSPMIQIIRLFSFIISYMWISG